MWASRPTREPEAMTVPRKQMPQKGKALGKFRIEAIASDAPEYGSPESKSNTGSLLIREENPQAGVSAIANHEGTPQENPRSQTNAFINGRACPTQEGEGDQEAGSRVGRIRGGSKSGSSGSRVGSKSGSTRDRGTFRGGSMQPFEQAGSSPAFGSLSDKTAQLTRNLPNAGNFPFLGGRTAARDPFMTFFDRGSGPQAEGTEFLWLA